MLKDTPFQNQETSPQSPSQLAYIIKLMLRGISREQGLPLWVLLIVFFVVLLAWNWQLIVATSLGILTMITVYAMQGWNWNVIMWRAQKFWQSPYRHLPIAVISGTLTVFLTYSILSIWSTQSDHWYAAASILQLGATLAVLGLLGYQVLTQWLHRQKDSLDQLVAQLTASDDLVRLMAVKNINQYLRVNMIPESQEQAIADYCQVLLNRETESIMREAIFETLESLQMANISPAISKSVTSSKI
ncbi:MAG: hypothetical protein AUK48_13260 [Oscillatoriales cyanobacterium CG2_30_44_21]|nr:MAG: hypothetical protein AUK48_13260 [Oscillatoriales cyanobacterium CG2_30_44_21]